MSNKTEYKKNSKKSSRQVLGWIYSGAKSLKWFLIGVVLLNGVSASFGTVTALISKDILDNAQIGNKGKLTYFCILFAVVSLVQILLFMLLRYLAEKLRAKMDIAFKQKLFTTVLSKRYGEVRSHHTGELINRLTGDIGVITDAVTSLPTTIASVVIRLVCAFTVLVVMQWQFALVFAVGGGIIYLVTSLLKEKIKSFHKEMQSKDGKVRSYWQEIIENLLVVKSFGAEEMAKEKSGELLDEHYKIRMRKTAFGSVSSGANHGVMRFGYIFALTWCAFSLYSGTMSFGTLTAITALVAQVQMPFSSLSGIMPKYYGALSSAERVMEIEELNDEIQSTSHSEKVLDYNSFKKISINNLDFSYGREKVLCGIDFEINKGDFVAVTGRSGIGKSTVFKLLLAIYDKDGGSIDFVFENETLPASPETRQLFAYVPQGNLLFSGTLRENLCFLAGEKEDKDIKFALNVACADSFVEELPDGLDTVIAEGGMGLSEGQAQRLAVARAILSDRPILLFDEATSALDEATERKMLENIKSLTNKTCIMVTHKPCAMELCTSFFKLSENK